MVFAKYLMPFYLSLSRFAVLYMGIIKIPLYVQQIGSGKHFAIIGNSLFRFYLFIGIFRGCHVGYWVNQNFWLAGYIRGIGVNETKKGCHKSNPFWLKCTLSGIKIWLFAQADAKRRSCIFGLQLLPLRFTVCVVWLVFRTRSAHHSQNVGSF